MRITLSILISLALAVLGSTPSWAHGGQYRGPGGGLPPGARSPSDPPPPPPPPTTGGPGPVTGGPSGGSPSPGSSPVTPGTGPSTPAAPGMGGGGARPAGPTLGMDNWVFWYAYNRSSLQELKRSVYTRMSSDSPMSNLGQGTGDPIAAATHATRALQRTQIIPTLLWALDPANAAHDDVESAAYIALAKVTEDPLHIALLKQGLARDVMTQEGATLALGLLRRTELRLQFSARDLDDVRETLFAAYEDESLGARARGFALLSVGLLGDQPSQVGAPATIARLFSLLARPDAHPDHPVAALMALGLQDRDAFTLDQRELLRGALLKGRLGGQNMTGFLRSYVALTIGRMGVAADVPALTRVITNRRLRDHFVSRSAAISLGLLGRSLSTDERAEVARTLLSVIDRSKDITTTNYSLISLAYLVEADVRDQRSAVIANTRAAQQVVSMAEGGSHSERTFAALSLGIMLKAIGPDNVSGIDAYGELRDAGLPVLREGLGSRALDKRSRAAFAVALGLAEDTHSTSSLLERVADTKEDPELRGYCALGLGHLRMNTQPVRRVLRDALRERSSEELRVHLADALGMLSDPEAVPLLLEELAQAQSQATKGQVVVALASIGDARAVAPLIASLRTPTEQALTRALACAGLGLVGDLEWVHSLALISSDINYRACGDMIAEVLTIL